MIPVLLLVSIISFALLYLLPGDPALLILGDQQASNREAYTAIRKELGLDKPVPIQYLDWLGKTLRGNLGTSTRDRQPIVQGIRERVPVTLELASFALLFGLLIALPAGIISAVRPNSWWDRVFSLISLTGVAIPNFWLGILLIYGLAIFAKLLPPSGFVRSDRDCSNHHHSHRYCQTWLPRSRPSIPSTPPRRRVRRRV